MALTSKLTLRDEMNGTLSIELTVAVTNIIVVINYCEKCSL